MKILAIETSCDETAISVVAASGGFKKPQFKVLSHLISSQVKLHAPYGGVVPSLAKREHSKNLIPLLATALRELRLYKASSVQHPMLDKIPKILSREPELLKQLLELIPTISVPKIDAIAVTYGPGLEPALWVGINFARALSLAWNKPLIPVNHMEGHIYSPLLEPKTYNLFPALALLISGGHTELVLVKDWLKYQVIGQTRDDAVGEAFDKVARLLDLPYPGGPALAKLADKNGKHPMFAKFPRPMIHSGDFDFSFSGLKTAVLYLVKKLGKVDDKTKAAIAREFQDAVIEVLVAKTSKAIEHYNPKTLIIGGGVIANTALREKFDELVAKKYPNVKLLIPDFQLATDNATMIALAAYFHIFKKKPGPKNIVARGTLSLR
ncbi:MAG: tRNA (adenosine(37)-N6)-threonylcarbamoyltransferase complex transferase subunit TsaD [Candidatus Vogelbacteria bacterium]|nr:tRNA (adenosine(37)-N6)-threonylcarbamoyltransferase complex transferase subunit TsaD [Candidatus Vogelbacteria bacterium]